MLILLDRDGVLNEDRPDFVKSPDELVMLAGAATAVARLNAAGHTIAVVSNQSGVGRGLMTQADLDAVNAALIEAVASAGGWLDAVIVCTDPPWAATARRKPGPGMLHEALTQFAAPPSDAVMIGDTLRDLEAAAALGIRRILVRSGKGRASEASGLPPSVQPVAVYDDLAAAAAALLAQGVA
ncbi:MAG: HAD-IIIA family hydrolase [Proteobacteria bacterium]|nr:HAD-IIIA family hydrolase [Pseudomonadota bacterium]MDA1060064.1 HAD-IIIA family hydrolase [Pseudomonadota bacterium]